MKQKLSLVFTFSALLFANIYCSGGTKTVGAPYSGPILDQYTSDPSKLLVIETKQGTMKIQLFDKVAPNHVARISQLASEGKYDGTTFHRVKEDLIQGGDPNSKGNDRSLDGIGGMGTPLGAEFNNVSHKRGICSMARNEDINSASSQFFICVEDRARFDHHYSIWGQVVEGYATLDSIAKLAESNKYPRASDGSVNPWKDAVMTKVFIEERK
jgi:cyclophilin family peptidyl-prolyl cis-trans isomerase